MKPRGCMICPTTTYATVLCYSCHVGFIAATGGDFDRAWVNIVKRTGMTFQAQDKKTKTKKELQTSWV